MFTHTTKPITSLVECQKQSIVLEQKVRALDKKVRSVKTQRNFLVLLTTAFSGLIFVYKKYPTIFSTIVKYFSIIVAKIKNIISCIKSKFTKSKTVSSTINSDSNINNSSENVNNSTSNL
jgi:hypothetical protein